MKGREPVGMSHGAISSWRERINYDSTSISDNLFYFYISHHPSIYALLFRLMFPSLSLFLASVKVLLPLPFHRFILIYSPFIASFPYLYPVLPLLFPFITGTPFYLPLLSPFHFPMDPLVILLLTFLVYLLLLPVSISLPLFLCSFLLSNLPLR